MCWNEATLIAAAAVLALVAEANNLWLDAAEPCAAPEVEEG